MATVVNLRTHRKHKARRDKQAIAAANRALHGRSKDERTRQAADQNALDRALDAHRLDAEPGSGVADRVHETGSINRAKDPPGRA